MPKNFDKDIFFHIVACKINEIPLSQMGTWLKFFQDFFKPDGHETIYASNGNEHFSLNNVTIRPTKIMNRASKHLGACLENKVQCNPYLVTHLVCQKSVTKSRDVTK